MSSSTDASRGGSGAAGLNSEQGDIAASSGQNNGEINQSQPSQTRSCQIDDHRLSTDHLDETSNEAGSRGLSGNKQ